MLTLRKRGRVYHVRGSVRLGGETRRVEEHSTGCDRREDAEAYRARLEHDIRQALRRLAADNPAHRGIVTQPFGIVHIFIASQTTEHCCFVAVFKWRSAAV